MNAIQGFEIGFNIRNLIKVTDLIYFDGPILSHYISQRGENYLFYWVDVDASLNRWLFLKVDLSILQDYINKKTTLYHIIAEPEDEIVYCVDIDSDINYHNIKIVKVNDLDPSYIPIKDSFYEFEPTDALDIYAISKKFNSGILDIRVSGKGVKYGSMSLAKLAPIISQTEDIRNVLSLKYIKDRKKHFTDSEKLNVNTKMLTLNTQFDFVYSLAGSFRLILRPADQQTSIMGVKSFSDDFAEEMINLFNCGFDKSEIERFNFVYKKDLIKKYADFVKYLDENSLGIDLSWCNSYSDFKYSKTIKVQETKKIIENLSTYDFDETEEFKSRGRFFALNTHNGKYSFETTEDDGFRSNGTMDESRRKSSLYINFSKEYDVVIKRNVSEQVGGKEKTKDLLISFIEVVEDLNS